ncbi:MAG: hypothetical protein AB1700_19235, partial [Bacillota bacterium]
MIESPDTGVEIRDDRAVQAIGTVYSRLWTKERRARVSILTGPSEHVIERTRPEDLEIVTNVMVHFACLLREPNDTKSDNLYTFLLVEEGSARITAARRHKHTTLTEPQFTHQAVSQQRRPLIVLFYPIL